MKKSKKILLSSTICSVAMVSFGCVYGPPPDEDMFESPSDSVSVMEYELLEQNSDSEELQPEK
ncbi:MAG: hypothetical protein K2H19_02210 [Ruminococcus sp.]|nr:hypothetical protein [Ruminococcus sp.]